MRMRVHTPSPVQNSMPLEEWACSSCTLLNTWSQRVCAACEAPQPGAMAPRTPPTPERAIASKKAAMGVKPGKLAKLANPLPQRNIAPRQPPRTLIAGLVYASSKSNAASGPKWAERPVERLNLGHGSCSQKADEEEDPDLACYIWNRQLNRPKVERYQRANANWGLTPKWGLAS